MATKKTTEKQKTQIKIDLIDAVLKTQYGGIKNTGSSSSGNTSGSNSSSSSSGTSKTKANTIANLSNQVLAANGQKTHYTAPQLTESQASIVGDLSKAAYKGQKEIAAAERAAKAEAEEKAKQERLAYEQANPARLQQSATIGARKQLETALKENATVKKPETLDIMKEPGVKQGLDKAWSKAVTDIQERSITPGERFQQQISEYDYDRLAEMMNSRKLTDDQKYLVEQQMLKTGSAEQLGALAEKYSTLAEESRQALAAINTHTILSPEQQITATRKEYDSYKDKASEALNAKWKKEKEGVYAGIPSLPEYNAASAMMLDREYNNQYQVIMGMVSDDEIQTGILTDPNAWTKASDALTYRQYMTLDEKKTYSYLYNTEGEESAAEYFDYILRDHVADLRGEDVSRNGVKIFEGMRISQETWDNLERWAAVDTNSEEYRAMSNKQKLAANVSKWFISSGAAKVLDKELGHWENVLESTVSVGATMLSGIGAIDAAVQKLIQPNKPVIYGSPAMDMTRLAQSARQGVSQDFSEKGKFAYNVIMSIADSAAVAGLAMMGVPFTGAILGGSAASQQMLDMHAAGYKDSQVITVGMLAGVCEALFEEVSIEKLITAPAGRTLGKRILQTLIQAGTEGSEETVTGIANFICEAIVLGDKSEYNKKKREYRLSGMTEEQAAKKAGTEWLCELALETLAGAISGGIMGGGAQAIRGIGQVNLSSAPNQILMQTAVMVAESDKVSLELQEKAEAISEKLWAGYKAEENADAAAWLAEQGRLIRRKESRDFLVAVDEELPGFIDDTIPKLMLQYKAGQEARAGARLAEKEATAAAKALGTESAAKAGESVNAGVDTVKANAETVNGKADTVNAGVDTKAEVKEESRGEAKARERQLDDMTDRMMETARGNDENGETLRAVTEEVAAMDTVTLQRDMESLQGKDAYGLTEIISEELGRRERLQETQQAGDMSEDSTGQTAAAGESQSIDRTAEQAENRSSNAEKANSKGEVTNDGRTEEAQRETAEPAESAEAGGPAVHRRFRDAYTKSQSERERVQKRLASGQHLAGEVTDAREILPGADESDIKLINKEAIQQDEELRGLQSKAARNGIRFIPTMGAVSVKGTRISGVSYMDDNGKPVIVANAVSTFEPVTVTFDHEFIHIKMMQNPSVRKAVCDYVATVDGFDTVFQKYAEHYENLLAEKSDAEAAAYIAEEMLCDAYAGYNRFNSGVTDMAPDLRAVADAALNESKIDEPRTQRYSEVKQAVREVLAEAGLVKAEEQTPYDAKEQAGESRAAVSEEQDERLPYTVHALNIQQLMQAAQKTLPIMQEKTVSLLTGQDAIRELDSKMTNALDQFAEDTDNEEFTGWYAEYKQAAKKAEARNATQEDRRAYMDLIEELWAGEDELGISKYYPYKEVRPLIEYNASILQNGLVSAENRAYNDRRQVVRRLYTQEQLRNMVAPFYEDYRRNAGRYDYREAVAETKRSDEEIIRAHDALESLTTEEEMRFAMVTDERQAEDTLAFINDEKKFKGGSKLAEHLNRVIKGAIEQRKVIRNYLMENASMLQLPEEIIGNPFEKNGSYGWSYEPTTICSRSIGVLRIQQMVSEALGRPLTARENFEIAQESFQWTDMPQCLYCFAAMDRMAKSEFMMDYVNRQNVAVEFFENHSAEYETNGDLSEETLKQGYDKYRTGTGKLSEKYKEQAQYETFMGIYERWKNDDRLLTLEDVATDKRIQQLIEEGGDLGQQVYDANRYAQSASWAKKTRDYLAYDGNILGWSQERVDMLNAHYGLRLNSDSEYSPAFALEYMQIFTDAAARQLKVLEYTKELNAVRAFAETGAAFNISTAMLGDWSDSTKLLTDLARGKNANKIKPLRAKLQQRLQAMSAVDLHRAWNEIDGMQWTDGPDKVVWQETRAEMEKRGMDMEIQETNYIGMDAMQGADWAGAMELRDKHGNVSIIAVALNDAQTYWALKQDWVDVVIPMHLVKTGTEIAKFMDWNNTKQISGDKKKKSWKAANEELVEPVLQQEIARISKENPELDEEAVLKKAKATQAVKEAGLQTSIYPEQHHNSKEEYLQRLEENHLNPRFQKYLNHPNYMKLVNETRISDKDLKPVQPIFNLQAIQDGIAEMQGRGGYGELLGRTTEGEQYIADEMTEKFRPGPKFFKGSERAKVAPGAKFAVSEQQDAEYMEAYNKRDWEKANELVRAAAKAAGYTRTMYHQTGERFTVFDINKNDHSTGDKNTPYGIFTKLSNNDLGYGFGPYQMYLYVKANNIKVFENREQVVEELPQEYRDILQELSDVDEQYMGEDERLFDNYLEAEVNFIESQLGEDYDPLELDEWQKQFGMSSTDMIMSKVTYPDPECQRTMALYKAHSEEWTKAENRVIAKARQYITDYLRSNGYDAMYLMYDAGTMGRSTDALIVLDNTQVKSTQTFEMDDDGNIIPLSQRFNDSNPDIRYAVNDEAYDVENLFDYQTGYESVPDNLMGFSSNLYGKSFDEQNYPYTLDLLVSVDGGQTFDEDSIKGMNFNHAIERAKRNWDEDGVVLRLKRDGEGARYAVSDEERQRAQAAFEAGDTEALRQFMYETNADPAHRSEEDIRQNRKMSLFSVEYPKLQHFIKTMAKMFQQDIAESVQGQVYTGQYNAYFGKRQTTKPIENLLDRWGLTWKEVEDTIAALAEDKWENIPNTKAFKAAEVELDRALRHGYKRIGMNYSQPIQPYIRIANQAITGYATQEEFLEAQNRNSQARDADRQLADPNNPYQERAIPTDTMPEEYNTGRADTAADYVQADEEAQAERRADRYAPNAEPTAEESIEGYEPDYDVDDYMAEMERQGTLDENRTREVENDEWFPEDTGRDEELAAMYMEQLLEQDAWEHSAEENMLENALNTVDPDTYIEDEAERAEYMESLAESETVERDALAADMAERAEEMNMAAAAAAQQARIERELGRELEAGTLPDGVLTREEEQALIENLRRKKAAESAKAKKENGEKLTAEEWEAVQTEMARQAAEKSIDIIDRTNFSGGDAMKAMGIRISGSFAEYQNIENVVRVIQANQRMAKALDREIRKLERKTDPKEWKAIAYFADGLAKGDLDMLQIPRGMDMELLQKLTELKTAQRAANTDYLDIKKNAINRRNRMLAEELLSGQKDRKVGIGTLNLMNPWRVSQAIYEPAQAERVYAAYFQTVRQNEGERQRFVTKQFDAIREIKDSKGKNHNANPAERALIQMAMESRSMTETMEQLTEEERETIGKEAAIYRETGKFSWNSDDMAETEFTNATLPGETAEEEAARRKENGKTLTNQQAEIAIRMAGQMTLQEAVAKGEMVVDGRKYSVDRTYVQAVADKMSALYQQFYKATNEFLVAHGQEPIGFIKDYAPHMQPDMVQNGMNRLLELVGMPGEIGELNASLAGLTHTFKPNKRWNPFFLHRSFGQNIEYDAMAGFENYVQHMSDVIYHMDDIMRLRRGVTYLRENYLTAEDYNEVKAIKDIREDDYFGKLSWLTVRDLAKHSGKYTAGQIDRMIDDYEEIIAKGSGEKEGNSAPFVMWMENYANVLAGKQSALDRGREATIDRGRYPGQRGIDRIVNTQTLNAVMGKVLGSNVVASFSSMMNQTSQVADLHAEIKEKHILHAMRDMVTRNDDMKLFRMNNDFLTERRGVGKLNATVSQRMDEVLATPAKTMDGMLAQIIARSAYYQGIEMGMTERQADEYASNMGEKIQSSRARGSKAAIHDSKNVLPRLLTAFNNEALNTFEHHIYDMPKQFQMMAKTMGPGKAAKELAKYLVSFLLTAFIWNRLCEEIYGSTPVVGDLLGLGGQFVANGYGYTLNDGMRVIINNVLGTELDTGEEYNALRAENFDGEWSYAAAMKGIRYNAMRQIPMLSNVAGFLGYDSEYANQADSTIISSSVKGVLEQKSTMAECIKEGNIPGAIEAAFSLLSYTGAVKGLGRQARKTEQGISMMVQGGKYNANGNLQYAVDNENPLTWIQAAMFGKSATQSAQRYYAATGTGSKYAANEYQTAVYDMLVEDGMDEAKAYGRVMNNSITKSELKVIQDMVDDGTEPDAALSIVEKNRKPAEEKEESEPKQTKADKLADAGMSYSDAYTLAWELGDIESDKVTEDGETKTVSGSLMKNQAEYCMKNKVSDKAFEAAGVPTDACIKKYKECKGTITLVEFTWAYGVEKGLTGKKAEKADTLERQLTQKLGSAKAKAAMEAMGY